MTPKEMIEVLQAFENGDAIEIKPNGYHSWVVTDDPKWDFVNCKYRIAPKPKKQVQVHAWFDGENFFYLKEGVKPKFESKRIQFQDKIIEVEDE